jgi:hypothetical protein
VDGPVMGLPPSSSLLSSLLISVEAAMITPTHAASQALGPMRHITAPCLHGYCFTCLIPQLVVWRCAIAYRAVADACRAYYTCDDVIVDANAIKYGGSSGPGGASALHLFLIRQAQRARLTRCCCTMLPPQPVL